MHQTGRTAVVLQSNRCDRLHQRARIAACCMRRLFAADEARVSFRRELGEAEQIPTGDTQRGRTGWWQQLRPKGEE